MLRRIVLLRGHEPLLAAWQARSFAPAGVHLTRNVQVKGMSLEEKYHPVSMPGTPSVAAEMVAAARTAGLTS